MRGSCHTNSLSAAPEDLSAAIINGSIVINPLRSSSPASPVAFTVHDGSMHVNERVSSPSTREIASIACASRASAP